MTTFVWTTSQKTVRYNCARCAKWWERPAIPVSCSVLHSPDSCCHYGERDVTMRNRGQSDDSSRDNPLT